MKINLLSIIVLSSFLLMINNSIATPLSGNYTINSTVPTSGNNFQSFNDLADSLNLNGVSGNVLVTVLSGTGPYTGQVSFNNIQGTGPAATITINGNGETLSAVTDSAHRYILRLKEVEYFSIANLHLVRDTASLWATYGIHILNSGSFITISGCNVDLSGTTTTLTGAYIASGDTASILVTGDFHNITITGDTATGGGYGASVFGLISNLASNIVISNNVFYDFHTNGIYLRETDGAVISGNFLDKRTPNVTSVNAIQIAQAANINTKIFNNVINVSQTSNGTQTFRAIYLFNGTGHKVYNNVISNIKLTSGNFVGILVRSSGTAPEIYFNTISIDNTSASTGDFTGISEELSNTNSVIKNNLISISQPSSGTKAGISLGAISTVTSAITSDYNLIYVPGGNIGMKDALTPTFYPALSDWQAITAQDANSVSADAGLTLASAIPTTSAANGIGTPIGFVTTDILGNPRGTSPDAGAYEFSPVSVFDFNHSFNINVYPNPARNEINIGLSQSNSPVKISIYNSAGQLEFYKEAIPALVSEKIQTEDFARGLHFIKIESENEIRMAKVILQ
jgi:hypothetical protein